MAQGTLSWGSSLSVFRAMLVAPSYVFNADHRYVTDVQAHEVVHSSYSRQNVVSRVGLYDDALDRGYLDADDTIYPTLSGVTVGGVIIYKQAGGNDLSPGDDMLLVYFNFSPAVVADGNNFKVEYAPQGLIALI